MKPTKRQEALGLIEGIEARIVQLEKTGGDANEWEQAASWESLRKAFRKRLPELRLLLGD